MAGIVNKPLAIFRKTDSSKPLHARWGDVGISVPTEGSWSQYENPHRRIHTKQRYETGFVPDCSPTSHREFPHQDREDRLEDDKRNSKTTTSICRRGSLSLNALRPRRLASRPKQVQTELPVEQDEQLFEQKVQEFAYKPIHQDYSAEVIEKSRARAHRFRYIPTDGRYGKDIPTAGPRSQSARSYRSSRARRDSFTDCAEEYARGREHYRCEEGSLTRGSHLEDDRRSLRSSVGDSSDSSSPRFSFGLPPRRRTPTFISADRKRASSLKPMTLTMVPDPDELYE